MANDISKIKLPGSTTEYSLKDGSAVANITRSGTTFTATRRNGTTFTFTQQDNNTTYTLSAGTGDDASKIILTPSSGTANKITVPYATSAGSASSATSATTASKLSANAGSATTPVYFTGGVPTACTYSLNKTVPSDAVFTDTNTHRPIQVNGTEILGNNTTALNLKAGSNVSVTNSSGTVTIAATDTNNAVTQTECNTNASYELLFANSAGTGTETAGVKKNSGLYYNAADGDRALIIRSKNNTYLTSIRPLEITTNGRIIVQNTSEQKDIILKGGAGYVRFATDIPANGKVYVEGQTLNATKNLISMDSSGNVFVSGTSVKIDTNNNLTATGELVSGSGLELGNASADAASFIDFHWNNNTNDYTARIIQRGESTVDLIGKNGSTWGIWRAASFSSQSSIHVKENVQSITAEDAKKLLQLRPVTFNYKNGGQVDQAGLIAEEVYFVMPKMVIGDINFNPEEPWNAPSIDYSKFTPYLIKMVQEQQKEIDELRRLVQG